MTDKEAVIIEGLAAGETVATGGNFLIDSQMQLAGNPSLMDPSRAPSFAPGPLELPENNPRLLAGESGAQFDRAYNAYFEIQTAMAADTTPPPVALNTLIDGLARLEMLGDVPDEAQKEFGRARRARRSHGWTIGSSSCCLSHRQSSHAASSGCRTWPQDSRSIDAILLPHGSRQWW